MGEWSEYFEDFPEENPANYVEGHFDPEGVKALRQKQDKLTKEQADLHREIAEIIRKVRMDKTIK